MRLHQLLAVTALAGIWGCYSPDRDASETGPAEGNAPAPEKANALPAPPAVDSDRQAVTIGPYTWPPENAPTPDRPNSFRPKFARCWATLNATPNPDFPNPYDTIRGPVVVAYLRDLKAAGHNLHHDDWSGRVVAVTAGDVARVTVYPEEQFGGEPHTLEPGEKLIFAEESPLGEVASLKIEYAP